MSNNHKNAGHKGMTWMMISCLLLLGVLFLRGDNLSLGGDIWPILVGVFMVAHVWVMLKGHDGDTSRDYHEHDPKHQ
ncbi:MAG: hypothetical protein A2660_00080 [Candidatus Doudnabacteria bacterium RIFCSPHIGHO2_01_FULL_45_18]|uniref:Uncharacterized protein n=1 Tax=Candidatus Doudnabacteria bacterium RIFCSPHIGHO2_01_FULL_45_18 TaxID=1817823 RepID=A0A1F5NS86_9BACT|nr:MAG: hypothetical protein A2660_00080 [Candidatus Doudnabacteria bacterium RIFCSPHIGHO2_01_FULL_45_18]